MTSDEMSALAAVAVGGVIVGVPPIRRLFVELFGTNDQQRRERELLEFEPVAYANSKSSNSARLADDKALKKAGLFGSTGWRFGYSQSGRVIRYGGPGHMMLVAPPRSGKAVSVLVPMLLEKRRGSVIVIDPKGELAAITADRAKEFSDVLIVAPFGPIPGAPDAFRGLRMSGFNPLNALKPDSISFGGDIDDRADGIVLHQSGAESNFFDDRARELVAAVMRIVVRYYPKEEKNLYTVRRIIAGNVFAFAKKWANCNDEIARDELAEYAQDGAEKRKSLGDCISTARTQTAFIAKEGIMQSLREQKGFRFADVKRKPMTVYIVLPLDKLASCGKWFRLCMASMLSELLAFGSGGLPVLCICDEFFSIGPLRTFQAAMSQAAGAAKLQLLPVLQDLAQLETMYPNQGWRTFLSCAALKIFFGSHGDKQTSDYVSEMAGEREVVVHSVSLHRNPRGKLEGSNSASTTWQPLIQPHEIRRMDLKTEMIAFVENLPGPLFGKRRAYFECREFSGQYRPNPYYRGKK